MLRRVKAGISVGWPLIVSETVLRMAVLVSNDLKVNGMAVRSCRIRRWNFVHQIRELMNLAILPYQKVPSLPVFDEFFEAHLGRCGFKRMNTAVLTFHWSSPSDATPAPSNWRRDMSRRPARVVPKDNPPFR